MNTLTLNEPVVKIRPNLFQLATGHVIGYGPRLAPDGLGYCFTCGGGDCQHVATVDRDWEAGGHSVESTAVPTFWWTVNGIDAFRVNRETGEVSYPQGGGSSATPKGRARRL